MDKYIRKAVFLVMLSLLIFILYGKLFFNTGEDIFLYVYGITVTIVIFGTFFLSERYKDPSVKIINEKLNAGKKLPLVSLMVAVYNDENIISRCVDSLISQSYPNKEVIVVNDCSTDKTKEVLRKYIDNPLVKIINLEKNVGKKRALAKAMQEAKGSIYLHTDSDSILDNDATSRIAEIFMYYDSVGAVSGHGRALNSDKNILTKIQDSWYEGQFSIKKAFESTYGTVTCVSGPLAAYRKEAIYNLIPAWINDTFLGDYWKFSTDRTLTGLVLANPYIGEKLKKKYSRDKFVKSIDYPCQEWDILYCKSAKSWTEVPDTLKKLIRQQVRWKKSFIRNLFFTGSFFWRKPLIPVLKYYLGSLFVLVGPFIIFRQLIYMPFVVGVYSSAIYYLLGVLFVGSLFAVAFKLEHKESRVWIYRPLMSLLSTFVLSWLIFYSLATIKKSIWHRG